MSGPRYVNGQVAGGVLQITYSRTGVVVAGAGGDFDEDAIAVIGGPAGYKGKLLALFVVSQVGVNDTFSLGIADVNGEDYMPLTVLGPATNQNEVDFMDQQVVDACREFSGEVTGNNDAFRIYAEASSAGAGTVDIHALVEWVPGDAPVIPDTGGG